MNLLDDHELERSEVVANASMNRGRGLRGVNSYERELRLDVLAFLEERLAQSARTVCWVDLCCGRGTALLEAATLLSGPIAAGRLQLHGVDLMPDFAVAPSAATGVSFETASLRTWAPPMGCDLVTCVHGIHYLGDKLDLLRRAARWLVPGGLLALNLDLDDLLDPGGRSLGPHVARILRRAGVAYSKARRLVSMVGPREIPEAWRYVGADDRAGANYTHQPTVRSVYEPVVG